MVNLLARVSYRAKESLKYRLFYGYCNLLRQIKFQRSPQIKWNPLNPNLPLFVVTTRLSDIPLLTYNLSSMMRQTASSPPMWIVGDSDAAYDGIQAQFADAPPYIQCLHWLDLLKRLPIGYTDFIKSWCERQWGGFGKKFTAYFVANCDHNILLLDCDILWFGNFMDAISSLNIAHDRKMTAGRDYQRFYDLSAIHTLQDNRLLEQDPMNVGFVYVPQGLLPKILHPDKLEALRPCLKEDCFHFEQTIMAHAFWEADGQWFAPEELATTLVDNFQLTSSVKALTRHYAGGKHLFWRDA